MSKAQQAAKLRATPLLGELLEQYRKDLFEQWIALSDGEARDELWALAAASVHVGDYIDTECRKLERSRK